MAAIVNPAGFYGKLPALGDFVSRRLPRQFIEPWDRWLQDGLAASRGQLAGGWLDIYLTSPIWRFGLSAGLCGAEAWAGLMMPSVDRVGRYFPLVVAAPVVSSDALVHLFETGSDWFAALERLALAGLEDGFDVDAFDRALRMLPSPALDGSPAAADGGQGRWALCIAMEGLERTPSALVGMGGTLLDRFLPSYSLWLTEGSERVGASLLLCEGLPPAEGFAALLTGDWQQRGWNMNLKRLFGWGKATSAAVAQPPSPGPAAHHWRWRSCGLSVVGHRRRINEDAFLERPDLGLWAVADGMGGHHAGDLASRTLVEALAGVEAAADLDRFAAQVGARIREVNGQLHRYAATVGEGQVVGSTVVAFLARGGRCTALWAGDSRLYRWRAGRLEQLTRDHSLRDELIDAGLCDTEQALTGADDNIITRAVGAEATLELDSLTLEAQAGDVFLLCSDGLAKELHPDDIAARLQSGDCEGAAKALIETALAWGGRDNVTVVVIRPELEA